MPVQFDDRARHLDILLPTIFPSDLTRVALVERPAFGEWPHVEDDGLLCLPSRLPNEHRPIDDVEIAIADAVALVEDSAAGRNHDDLRDEFYSYWNPTATGDRRVVSILEPVGPSRSIVAWHGQTHDVVSGSETDLRRWLGHRDGRMDTHGYSIQRALLLWLRQVPTPNEYPRHAADLLRMAEEVGGADALIELSLDPTRDGIVAIFGSETRNGPVLAGIGVRRPKIIARGSGYRPGKVPHDVHVGRYFGAGVHVERYAVDRADPTWIHGRGADFRQGTLRNRSVVVVGSGSLGAPIALSLAQAGIGKIDVLDPQQLLWGNVGRHPLGAEYVGRNKAEGIADRIRRSYPHIRHAAGHAWRWEDAVRSSPKLFESADIVVSALGDWPSESALNGWHLERGRAPAIVYTWTEAHGAAGHAVAALAQGGCLRCGFDSHGSPLLEVAKWRQESTLRQEPGCGALFQPYGPAELQHTVALANELVLDVLLGAPLSSLHRVWAASRDFVEGAGGHWTPAWQERSRATGAVVESFEWARAKSCPACGQR